MSDLGLDTAIPLDRLRDGVPLHWTPTEAERAALAERLDLLALERVEAELTVTLGEAGAVRATGRVRAALTQRCVATGEPVAALVDEPFALSFLPDPGGDPDSEIELDADELDCVLYDGRAVPLGAALADTLALALDPYPRSAGADAALRAAGVRTEEEMSPFAALAALKGRLGGDV